MSAEAFVAIQRKAIEQAERVDCEPDDFRLGLVAMWHELQERLDCENINPRDPEVLDQLEQ